MADGLIMHALEKVRPIGGPVNRRTTKNRIETKNSERAKIQAITMTRNFAIEWDEGLYRMVFRYIPCSIL